MCSFLVIVNNEKSLSKIDITSVWEDIPSIIEKRCGKSCEFLREILSKKRDVITSEGFAVYNVSEKPFLRIIVHDLDFCRK
jgi:hypothetical protein